MADLLNARAPVDEFDDFDELTALFPFPWCGHMFSRCDLLKGDDLRNPPKNSSSFLVRFIMLAEGGGTPYKQEEKW